VLLTMLILLAAAVGAGNGVAGTGAALMKVAVCD